MKINHRGFCFYWPEKTVTPGNDICHGAYRKCEEIQKFYSVMTQAPSGVPVVLGHKQIQTSDRRGGQSG
ncbi:hypothetical protein FOV73_25100 [Escherichia coli]|nr:hypothetical protein FOV73_25100 [Escherichia coli]